MRSHHLPVAAVPDLPEYLKYQEVLLLAPALCLYLHNTVPDVLRESLVQKNSLHTWTYDLHYRSPSQVQARTYLRFQLPFRSSDLRYPSESGFFHVPVNSHRSHRDSPDHGRYLKNAVLLLY